MNWNPLKRQEIQPDNAKLRSILGQGAKHGNVPFAELYGAICDATLLVPTDISVSHAPGTVPPVLTLEMYGLQTAMGFTDHSAVKLHFHNSKVHCVSLTGLDLCRKAVSVGAELIFLNPASPAGYRMVKQEFQPLAEGLVPDGKGFAVAQVATDIQIGKPSASAVPTEKIEAIQSVIRSHNITEAYWFLMRVPGGETHLAFAIAPPDLALIKQVHDEVTRIFSQRFSSNEVVYSLPLNDGESVTASIRAVGVPLC